MSSSARQHIEEIRTEKFSIGREPSRLSGDLHRAVKYLSAEIYAKDVHFLMELIQNAEDNNYLEEVDPSLEFIITSRDITATGAPATLLIFNNERGFSAKNIESICSVGDSTKKGLRKSGYIGEKGIGFKSVFLITARPYIFSNGYQIRFHEGPCLDCSLGYIVPEWVDKNPSLSEIQQIYGSNADLPTTVLVLPLKPDKVEPVKQQLSRIHPEVLLFLSKIKRLSVREDNDDPRLNTVNAISILSETNFVQRKDHDAESYTLILSAEESTESEKECSYYMWKQKFPVRQESKVENRMEMDELAITLAFPMGDRPHRGLHSPGIYAFLPTEMVTNFPFIIQADFLLATSRETILLDNKWNKGILDCVPHAFINAFTSLVKAKGDAPIANLPHMFRFLPVNNSTYQVLNAVRESIKAKLVEQDIVPSEPLTEQKLFHKPREVGRLMPGFWSILNKAREQGVSLLKLSSHGKYILSYSFDKEEYDHILGFLGVEPVDCEWYAKCIQSSNLVHGVSDNVYLELLKYIADNWTSKFYNTNMKNIPLLKYVDHDEKVSMYSINGSKKWNGDRLVYLSSQSQISWLIKWNAEFRSVTDFSFMPESTQEALRLCSNKEALLKWLVNHAGVGAVNVYDYAVLLKDSLGSEPKPVIAYAHFLYHSLSELFLSSQEVNQLGGTMPLVDSYGYVIKQRNGVLVPANGSKWTGLIVSNLWKENGYVELGEDYVRQGIFAGKLTSGRKLVDFLTDYAGASDVPYISPPNARIPAVSSSLTKQNAFLLLDWIRYQKGCRIPEKFLSCIKEGSWLNVTLNGSPGCRPPSQSFLHTSSWGSILQNGSVRVDIPLIDQRYYGDRIYDYKEELKRIGVMFEYGEACKFIGKRLMHLAASSTLTRGDVFSILNFIKFLRANFFPPEQFISSIKGQRWLKTSCGDKAPDESVLFDEEWRTASKVSDIPFIEKEYYGEEILRLKKELELLGVVVAFRASHQLVIDYLKPPSRLTYLTKEAFLLILECMRLSPSSEKLFKALKGINCLKTNVGYKSPSESLLSGTEWGCLLQVFNNGLPLIDQNFYGNRIYSYTTELKRMGVVVEFEEAAKVFARCFKEHASKASIRKENVISLLLCYKQLKGTSHKFPKDLKNCIRKEKWLRTRLADYKCPSDCILFGHDWESISSITLLPFIDDSDKYYGKEIHEFKKELKSMGAVVEFKDGAHFVADGLYLPRNPSCITSASVLSFLECIRTLSEKSYSFSDAFWKKVSQSWLKTHAGYRPPNKCLLFDSKWSNYLKPTDGPFIDDVFYGFKIASYKKELSAIGVIIDVEKGCPLIASHLDLHSEFPTIVRIYNYLSGFKWEPNGEAEKRIWIPDGSRNGKWSCPEDCVVSDKSGLFGLQLIALDSYYEQNLLVFFTVAFQVKSSPCFKDYFQLWKAWESSRRTLSHDECCKFWGYVSKHWSSRIEKTLADGLVKVPVSSGPDGILLSNKKDVFIADDLQLKDLFEQSSTLHPLFVWYPQPSLPHLPRTKLLEMFQKIGVRTISESVQKEEISTPKGNESEKVIPLDSFIGKGLVKLILGFLGGPSIKMEAERRKKAVQGVLNLTITEMVEPVTVSYNLSLSSGASSVRGPSRMIRWDRESSKIFTQKMDRSKGHKFIIEFATYFSEVISEGILWDNVDHIYELSEMIKLAFVLEFNEEAVAFLMKSKNLQIFVEDEEFLTSAFPSV